MDIIGCMARHTCRWSSFVVVAKVAGHAPEGLVLVVQGKSSLVVIESDMLPDLCVVAGGAIPSQPALVRLDAAVAVNAFVRGLAEMFAGPVAAVAGHVQMRAAQRKVSLV